MSKNIIIELRFFSISFIGGTFLMFVYDNLRIIRRLIKHKNIVTFVEDFLYWLWASFYIFSIIYKENNGILRGFAFVSFTFGMIIYFKTFSRFYVNLLARLLNKLIRFGKIPLRKIKKTIISKVRLLKEKINEKKNKT